MPCACVHVHVLVHVHVPVPVPVPVPVHVHMHVHVQVAAFVNVTHYGEECEARYGNAAHGGRDGAWRCLFGEYRLPLLRTPYMAIGAHCDTRPLMQLHCNCTACACSVCTHCKRTVYCTYTAHALRMHCACTAHALHIHCTFTAQARSSTRTS